MLSALEESRAGEGTTVVAIDGPSGVGKSTLADALREARNDVSLVRGDDFYRPMDRGARAKLGPAEGYEQYFDWRRLRSDVLVPLSQGMVGRYRRYDWSNDRLEEWHQVDPGEFVIVEGVYSTRPELRSFYSLTVFLETPRDERIRRILARDDDVAWVERWMAAEEWYVRHMRPAERADLVISSP